MSCDCNEIKSDILREYSEQKKREINQISNKWILDNLNRKLLITDAIYDIYGDIVGYLTKNEEGNVIRIFRDNVKKILD
jgi:hypothetical protein